MRRASDTDDSGARKRSTSPEDVTRRGEAYARELEDLTRPFRPGTVPDYDAARQEVAQQQAECAHMLPPEHLRPLWWEDKPSHCTLCRAKVWPTHQAECRCSRCHAQRRSA